MPSSPLRILFCGTPDFAVPSLQALAKDAALDVRLVITQPDRPAGRGKTLTPPPVKRTAELMNIPVWQPQNINRQWQERPVQECDVLVVVAYGQILSQEILDTPRLAPVNVHASLLPRWRGASPIHHALLAGDHVTGVTIQRMVRALDAGPVLAQEELPITFDATFVSLHTALSTMGAHLLVRTLHHPLQETPQDESTITLCGKLSRSDGDVYSATMSAHEIDRRVRALVPWPGVRLHADGRELKLLQTSLVATTGSFALPCAGGTTLHLVLVQPPSGKPMSGAAWAHGRK